ncbi:MAG TPA: hypothetical protein VFS43_31760 [Polyangiaceae bacterium]|nr:hypothetical protein [Polyangiaceae bacterium]
MAATALAGAVEAAPPPPVYLAAGPGADPMRNAGYTTAAYLLFFATLGAVLWRSRRRQRAIEARLGRLERALADAPRAAPAAAGGAHPLVRAAGHD